MVGAFASQPSRALPFFSRQQDETARQLRALPWPVAAVLPGAETGVLLADQLAARLGTRGNGLAQSCARRNKFDMGEAVRAAGVRAARQRWCRSGEEVGRLGGGEGGGGACRDHGHIKGGDFCLSP